MTWGDISRLRRECGISLEIKESTTFKTLSTQHPGMDNFAHIRVDGTGLPTRIFIGIQKELAYILFFDLKGTEHH